MINSLLLYIILLYTEYHVTKAKAFQRVKLFSVKAISKSLRYAQFNYQYCDRNTGHFSIALNTTTKNEAKKIHSDNL